LLLSKKSGGLMFDPQGNLFLGVGDNTSPFASDSYTPIDERPGLHVCTILLLDMNFCFLETLESMVCFVSKKKDRD
jgi:hypothetical protein